MVSKIGEFGERMLTRLVPQAKADAADCWWVSGYNCGYTCLHRRCCVRSNGTVWCACSYSC